MKVTHELSSLGKLTVSFSKLKKYIEQQGGYDLESEGPDRIVLSFVPAFPEALEKGWQDNPPPKVVMHGALAEGTVTFDRIFVEQENNISEKDPDVAELTYRDWLRYIEDSY